MVQQSCIWNRVVRVPNIRGTKTIPQQLRLWEKKWSFLRQCSTWLNGMLWSGVGEEHPMEGMKVGRPPPRAWSVWSEFYDSRPLVHSLLPGIQSNSNVDPAGKEFCSELMWSYRKHRGGPGLIFNGTELPLPGCRGGRQRSKVCLWLQEEGGCKSGNISDLQSWKWPRLTASRTTGTSVLPGRNLILPRMHLEVDVLSESPNKNSAWWTPWFQPVLPWAESQPWYAGPIQLWGHKGVLF